MLIGKVARPLSGASIEPTMPPVASSDRVVAARERLRDRQNERVLARQPVARGERTSCVGSRPASRSRSWSLALPLCRTASRRDGAARC